MRKNNVCSHCHKLFFYEGKQPDYCDSCSINPDIKKPILRKPSNMPKDSVKIGKIIDKETGRKVSLSNNDIRSH